MTCLAFLGFRQCFSVIKIKRESLRQLENERQYWKKHTFLKSKISFFYQNKVFCFCDFKIDSNQREVADILNHYFSKLLFSSRNIIPPRVEKISSRKPKTEWNEMKYRIHPSFIYKQKTSQGNFSFSTVNKLNKNKTVAFNDNFDPLPWFF